MKNVQKIALTGGLVWGATMAVTTLAYLSFGYGKAFLELWASLYPGYSLTASGVFVGAVYGFLDVFIGVYIIHWVYKKVGGK